MSPPSPPPRNFGQLLRDPFQALVERLHRELAAAGYPDVRPAHGNVFQHVRREGSRLTELAERAQLTKQTVGYLVDYLEGRGYVERVPDPSDARARLIRLTERGWVVRRLAGDTIRRIEGEWEQRLGAERMRALRDHLAALNALIDEEQAPDPAPPPGAAAGEQG